MIVDESQYSAIACPRQRACSPLPHILPDECIALVGARVSLILSMICLPEVETGRKKPDSPRVRHIFRYSLHVCLLATFMRYSCWPASCSNDKTQLDDMWLFQSFNTR